MLLGTLGGERMASKGFFTTENARAYAAKGNATKTRRRTQDDLSRYEGDPVAFMRALIDPETGEFRFLPCSPC